MATRRRRAQLAPYITAAAVFCATLLVQLGHRPPAPANPQPSAAWEVTPAPAIDDPTSEAPLAPSSGGQEAPQTRSGGSDGATRPAATQRVVSPAPAPSSSPQPSPAPPADVASAIVSALIAALGALAMRGRLP